MVVERWWIICGRSQISKLFSAIAHSRCSLCSQSFRKIISCYLKFSFWHQQQLILCSYFSYQLGLFSSYSFIISFELKTIELFLHFPVTLYYPSHCKLFHKSATEFCCIAFDSLPLPIGFFKIFVHFYAHQLWRKRKVKLF